MKNLLTLHEAVAVVLLKQPNRTATFQTIANEIERRNLFTERKGGITLAEQIKLIFTQLIILITPYWLLSPS